VRSPKTDPKKVRMPRAIALNDDNGQLKTFDRTTEVTIHPQNPIIVPSHVFFGLILVRGVLPNVLPPMNANVSAAIMLLMEIKVATRPIVQ
jgi:hypothetical protein